MRKVKRKNASIKKLALPVEWQVRPLSWGGARWQHRQETGDDVYDRPFPNVSDLEWYLADRYGWKFARKVLAALKTSTGEAVGTVKKNPKQSKGKTALKTTGRAVKSAVSSVLGAGSQILGAGSKALANGKRRKNKTVIKKAKKVIVLNKGKKKAAKPKRNPIRERLLPTGTRVRFKDGYEHGGMTGVITSAIPVYLKEKHWTYRIQLDGISGGKGQVLAQERLFSVINPKRRRNLDHKDSTHQVEVSKHWRAGGLSQWQRAHHAGQHDLFSHGIKAKPKRNPKGPIPTPQNQSEYKALYEEYSYWRTQAKSTAEKALLKKIKSAMARYEKSLQRASAPKAAKKRGSRRISDPTLVKRYTIGKAIISIRSTPSGKYTASWTIKGVPGYQTGISPRGGLNQYLRREFSTVAEAQEAVKEYNRNPRRNASRAVHTRKASAARGASSASRKATKRKVARSRKAVAKRNPNATEIRKKFAGTVNGSRELYFPKGTPAGQLAKLGRLVLIKTQHATIRPTRGAVWLCADTSGKLHLGSTVQAPMVAGPARNFGKVLRLEYESSKPHLGYGKPVVWFHRMGEEDGIRPTLHADSAGGLTFHGGAYRLTSRGIEN
jgi:hypothetical protein